jgi:hypothetical protein
MGEPEAKSDLSLITLPLAVYGVAIGLAEWLGFDLSIPWDYYQLLDRSLLRDDPLNGLYLLHSQPPLLNALLAIDLWLADALGCAPELPIKLVFLVIGLISTLALFRIATLLTAGIGFALLAVVLVVFDPAYFFFQNLYFYPFILQALFVQLFFASLVFLARGRGWALFAVAVLLAAITNARSLFPMLFSLLYFAGLVGLRLLLDGRAPHWRAITVAASLLVLLLVAWPLKNWTVFDQFTYSSWRGYNLSRGTPLVHSDLIEYMKHGRVPPSVERAMGRVVERHGIERSEAISSPTKGDSSARNWNHYVFVTVNAALADAAMQWRWEHPDLWASKTATHYWAWTRSSYVHPYTGEVRGPRGASRERQDPIYVSLSSLHRRIFFADFRAFLSRSWPQLVPDSLHGTNYPMTFFGVVLLPFVLLAALPVAWLMRRSCRERAAFVVLLWFCTVWVLAVPCLTDGTEGNRMRFAVSPALVLLVILLLNEAATGIRRRFPVRLLPCRR